MQLIIFIDHPKCCGNKLKLAFYCHFFSRCFAEKVLAHALDCKDASGLHFIKFDFMTGNEEIKIVILVEF